MTLHFRISRMLVCFCAALAVSFGAVQKAFAHPHEFISMRVSAAFDDAGKLAGFRYQWTFDEFFSAYALEGQDSNSNGKAEQNEVDALLVEILSNIKEIDYFTAFDSNNLVPKISGAEPVSAGVVADQLSVVFDVALQTPIALDGKTVKFAIYDDSFYTAMNYAVDGEAFELVNAPKSCKTKLELPEPDDDIETFASSLSASESSGFDLGAAFAEWASISCK